MIKILKGNITKCISCGAYIKYDSEDINTEERGFDVGTYNGETYLSKYIICPNCKRKIEVYTK